MTDTRVFLAEESRRFDSSSAERYGVLTYLSAERLDPFDTTGIVDLLDRALSEHGFDPSRDYVCMTGNMLVVSIFLSVVLSTSGRVRVLMFDARNSHYCERMIEAPGDS